MTMGIWAVLCLVLFLITFFTTRERIEPATQHKSSPKQDFADLLRNSPWIVMFILTLVHFTFVSLKGGAFYNYYITTPTRPRCTIFCRPSISPRPRWHKMLRPPVVFWSSSARLFTLTRKTSPIQASASPWPGFFSA